MKYFTDSNIEITKRIEKGQTFLIHGTDIGSEKEAEEIAKIKRSYVEEVFQENEKTGKRTHCGYGIPK